MHFYLNFSLTIYINGFHFYLSQFFVFIHFNLYVNTFIALGSRHIFGIIEEKSGSSQYVLRWWDLDLPWKTRIWNSLLLIWLKVWSTNVERVVNLWGEFWKAKQDKEDYLEAFRFPTISRFFYFPPTKLQEGNICDRVCLSAYYSQVGVPVWPLPMMTLVSPLVPAPHRSAHMGNPWPAATRYVQTWSSWTLPYPTTGHVSTCLFWTPPYSDPLPWDRLQSWRLVFDWKAFLSKFIFGSVTSLKRQYQTYLSVVFGYIYH